MHRQAVDRRLTDRVLVLAVSGKPGEVTAALDALAGGAATPTCPRGHWRGPVNRTVGPYLRCPLCLEPTKPEGQRLMRELFK